MKDEECSCFGSMISRFKTSFYLSNLYLMKDLDSYLNDHLAGSVSALELIAHWAHLHKDKPLGVFFSQIDTEIRADQNVLRNLMHALGVEESTVRQAGAWAAEK